LAILFLSDLLLVEARVGRLERGRTLARHPAGASATLRGTADFAPFEHSLPAATSGSEGTVGLLKAIDELRAVA
jgi:hypothetical protein